MADGGGSKAAAATGGRSDAVRIESNRRQSSSHSISGGAARSSAVGSVGSSTASGSRMSWTQLSSFMSSAHRNRMRISQQQYASRDIEENLVRSAYLKKLNKLSRRWFVLYGASSINSAASPSSSSSEAPEVSGASP